MNRIYVFPGQGSQKKGMGQELFARFPDLVRDAHDELGYDLVKICLEGPDEILNNTAYTQPALYLVNALGYLAKVADPGFKPDFLAGHSLGEYNALYAAGAFDFVTGLRLVAHRGAMMSKATGGGMAAVLGLTTTQVRNVLADNGFTHIDVANFNAPTQTVISGLAHDIALAEAAFKTAGAKLYVVLNVSGAFHSRYMTDAATEFRHYLNDFSFKPLHIPVIANCTGKPYENGEVADLLARQINSSVHWVDSIAYLLDAAGADAEFEEIGPGKVLSSLIRQIRKGA